MIDSDGDPLSDIGVMIRLGGVLMKNAPLSQITIISVPLSGIVTRSSIYVKSLESDVLTESAGAETSFVIKTYGIMLIGWDNT